MWNSDAIVERAGATIEDETGEMKVKDETTMVAAHFLLKLQFFGFSGSSGPSHEIWLVSAICTSFFSDYVEEAYQIGILG